MDQESSALLVHDRNEVFHQLKQALETQGIKTREVASRSEALMRLLQPDPPQVVFTDTALPDGTWTDLLSCVSEAHELVPVIVVSRLVDIDLYISALESGASDFIVPPFRAAELAYVVRCAASGREKRGAAVGGRVAAA